MIATVLTPALLFALQVQAPAPQRDVAKPGVIATNQRVTPAGVQTVFNDRVGGVRFGERSDEIWIGAQSAVWRMSWRDNRVVAKATFDGRPGVHGVTVDPVLGRVLVSTVGRLPDAVAQSRLPGGPPLARAKSFSQLFFYDRGGIVPAAAGGGDSVVVAAVSGQLGEFMSGAPAVARRAGANGKRLAVLPLPANDQLAVLDAETGKQLSTIDMGVLPIAAVINEAGTVAYVSVFGGPKPKPGELATKQCCDPLAEDVRVDTRGIAQPGTIARIDLTTGTITANIIVGRHPSGLVWDEKRNRLYVANGNSDAVSVIDTRSNTLAGVIEIAPFRERKIGYAPTAVALSPDFNRLYVTLGGLNAVGVYDVSATMGLKYGVFKGLIPTGWYPASIDISGDGTMIAVGTLLGVGSGDGRTSGHPGKTAGFVHSVRGSVNVIPVPTDAELTAYTTSVAQNNRLTLLSQPDRALAVRATASPRAVPERPGEASLINHVVFIVKENRTYDQVLGDIGKGASDSSLAMYGRDVTPNTHALAEQYVLLDHFFASGGNSADGHQWIVSANETEYPMWPLYYGRSYPSEGRDALAYSSGGFLWEGAQAKGKKVTIFGEYAPPPKDREPAVRQKYLAEWRDRQPHDPAYFRAMVGQEYNTISPIASLDRTLVREYPSWTQDVPDVVKADIFTEHVKEWEGKKAMPNLVMVILPSDHTDGTAAGRSTPASHQADNDLALGTMVEALTKSSFWKDMAIFVVEDDAQNGVDHIDGHRTVALAISPYTRRGSIDSTFYSQPSMVKTVELMLGLPAMSMFDLVATDMRASFIRPGEKPDFTPYSALVPKQSLYDVNVKLGAITGPYAKERRAAAVASAKMDFSEPDEAPSDLLNKILWHEAKGWGTRYPGVKQSLFSPYSVDIPDEERRERVIDKEKATERSAAKKAKN